jgi:hypothetical protein
MPDLFRRTIRITDLTATPELKLRCYLAVRFRWFGDQGIHFSKMPGHSYGLAVATGVASSLETVTADHADHTDKNPDPLSAKSAVSNSLV